MTKVVSPQLGAESFSCPHCGALAHQYWFRLFLKDFSKGIKPDAISYEEIAGRNLDSVSDDARRKALLQFRDRLKDNVVTFRLTDHSWDSSAEMVNLWLSRCYACDGFSVWQEDKIIYPLKVGTIIAHEEMPGEVREVFNEAASIIDKSPRGTAALLRLGIQKLMPFLGEKGKNINDDIGELVKKGLDIEIQRAMDILRVIGNNAVHPGQFDLKDDKATALKLFDLINLIVDRQIAGPKRIAALFMGLPTVALEGIKQRDEPKT